MAVPAELFVLEFTGTNENGHGPSSLQLQVPDGLPVEIEDGPRLVKVDFYRHRQHRNAANTQSIRQMYPVLRTTQLCEYRISADFERNVERNCVLNSIDQFKLGYGF
jgi:hypothetical protein